MILNTSYWHIANNHLNTSGFVKDGPPTINIPKLNNDWAKSETAQLCFYDDYNQHIRLAGLYFYRIDGYYSLATDEAVSISCAYKVADFASQFEQPELNAALNDLIGLRKLEAVLNLRVVLTKLALRDDESKCVVRAKVIASETGTYFHVEEIRGYQKAYRQLCKYLQKLGFKASQRIPFAQLYLDNLGSLPELPNTPLYAPKPDEKIAKAVCEMSVAMINRARSHESGIINTSEDTEFLHGYRVSMRKTRSLVSLMKDIFPAQQHRDFKQRLANIMRPTNRARDLDVYLLEQSDYEAMLPENLREGLPLMFADFRKQHSTAYKQLKIWLAGSDYSNEIEGCRNWFADQEFSTLPGEANLPVSKFVNKLVLKKYRKVIRSGEAITPESPDEIVHDLRLECKKFRYLLDFFGAIYPQEKLSKLLKKLKRMQNTLGAFNDYSVQQEALHEYLAHSRQNKKIHISVGALILVLSQKQIEQRLKVEAKFAEFAGPETAELIQELFSETSGKEKTKKNKKVEVRS